MSLREALKLSRVFHIQIHDIDDGRIVQPFEMLMKFLRVYGLETEMFLRKTDSTKALLLLSTLT